MRFDAPAPGRSLLTVYGMPRRRPLSAFQRTGSTSRRRGKRAGKRLRGGDERGPVEVGHVARGGRDDGVRAGRVSCADRPTGAVPRDERGFVQDGESYAPRMTWANVSSVAVLVPVDSAVRHKPGRGARAAALQDLRRDAYGDFLGTAQELKAKYIALRTDPDGINRRDQDELDEIAVRLYVAKARVDLVSDSGAVEDAAAKVLDEVTDPTPEDDPTTRNFRAAAQGDIEAAGR